MFSRIFIPTKNRQSTISTPRFFENFDYWVVVHDEQQAQGYRANAERIGYDPNRIIVSGVSGDQYGLTRQREWICNNIAATDEWFVFADDNIRTVRAVDESLFELEQLPVQDDGGLKPMFEKDCSAKRFLSEVVPQCIEKAESFGARHLGFATVDNFYFRGKKWKKTAYIIGKMMLWKNTGELQFDHTITMEDFELTAQSIAKFGVAPVNNWVFPVAKHYETGGMGTKTERLADRNNDIEILLKKYPGLFGVQIKEGNPDLYIRFHTENQIQEWRRKFSMLKRMKEV